jgi:acetyl-CoA synthetase
VSPSAWHDARAALDGLPDGRGLNLAHEAVDRHAARGAGDRLALRCLAPDGVATDVTYAGLRALTNRFANVLDLLAVRPGDVVFSLLGRGLETYVVALGTVKHTSVFSPLFAAFGPEPVRERLRLGQGRVLVTTAELFRRRIAPGA